MPECLSTSVRRAVDITRHVSPLLCSPSQTQSKGNKKQEFPFLVVRRAVAVRLPWCSVIWPASLLRSEDTDVPYRTLPYHTTQPYAKAHLSGAERALARSGLSPAFNVHFK
jgi:hypothetical protein